MFYDSARDILRERLWDKERPFIWAGYFQGAVVRYW